VAPGGNVLLWERGRGKEGRGEKKHENNNREGMKREMTCHFNRLKGIPERTAKKKRPEKGERNYKKGSYNIRHTDQKD